MKKVFHFFVKVSISVVILTAFLYLIISFVIIPLFTIRTVYIKGNHRIFSDFSQLKKSRNLLLLNTSEFEVEMKNSYPLIQKIIVKKQYPSTIFLEITERIPIATVVKDNERVILDEEGVVLSVSKDDIDENIEIRNCSLDLNEGVAGNPSLLHALKFGVLIRSFTKILSIECVSKDIYTVYIPQVEIRMQQEKNIQESVSSLQFLLNQFRIEGKTPEVVDLRFEKVVLIPDKDSIASSSSASLE